MSQSFLGPRMAYNGKDFVGVQDGVCQWSASPSVDFPSTLPNLAVFRRHLGALLAAFQCLQQEDRRAAVAMTRDALGRMQAVVKYQLCNDALRTVAALAETMIQEAYGFTTGDLPLAPSPTVASSLEPHARPFSRDATLAEESEEGGINSRIVETSLLSADLSIDNTDVLTNALYATLQAVNPSELSPSMQQQLDSSLSANDAIASGLSTSLERPQGAYQTSQSSGDQKTLESFFGPTSSKNSTAPVAAEFVDRSRILKCKRCNYVASHRQNLHRHEKLHELRDLPSEDGRRYPCALCDRRFLTKWALKEHTRYKHTFLENDNAPPSTSVPSGSDVQHPTVALAPEEASNPIEIGLSKNFTCSYCSKAFPMRNALKRHIDAVHLKTRNFKCFQCEKAFADNYHLQRHVQSVHMALRVYECPCCGKGFSTSSHMSRHMKSLHKELHG